MDVYDLISAAADCLSEHGHHRVADALRLVVTDVDSLPAAMGATSDWRSAARLYARNLALAALARHLAPNGMPASHLAERIAALTARYYASGWKADRRAGRRPDDALHGLLFDLLCRTRPLSVRTWRDLLGNLHAGDCHGSRAA
jgi:hypothetical protein